MSFKDHGAAAVNFTTSDPRSPAAPEDPVLRHCFGVRSSSYSYSASRYSYSIVSPATGYFSETVEDGAIPTARASGYFRWINRVNIEAILFKMEKR
jgi:hypothetical protein